MPEDWTTDRSNKLVLAAARGVWLAIKTDRHLGDAARVYGYESRTYEGDAFETAFLWAREKNNADGPV